MSTRRSREDDISFLAKAKDGVYKASEIVKEEAAVVEHMAQQVEKLSKSIEDDVDNVETLLHQVMNATNSLDKDKDEVGTNSNDSPFPSSKEVDQVGKLMAKDALIVRWPRTTFHIVFILLTLAAAVLLHHNWGSSLLKKNAVELNNNTTFPSTNHFTFLSILLIYMGSIWRVLKYTMNWQKNTVIKVEEKVHEIGQEVKSVANNIEAVADAVEHISQQVEEEASQIQSFLNPVKST